MSRAGPLAPLSVSLSTSVPASRPSRFVRVIGTGGVELGPFVLSQPAALVECWASSSVDACGLASDAWALLRATEGIEISPGLWVQEPRLTLPVDFPDATSGSPRWQFIFNPVVAQEES